jgi:hypothetical protein
MRAGAMNSLLETQPDKDNIFIRTQQGLEETNRNADTGSKKSKQSLKFEACKLTIKSMHSVLIDENEFEIQEADLLDYAYALRDINKCLYEFSISDIGTQYSFSKIIDPLEQAKSYLVEALGIKNIHSRRRTTSIQRLRSWLGKAKGLIEGLPDPPFTDQPP